MNGKLVGGGKKGLEFYSSQNFLLQSKQWIKITRGNFVFDQSVHLLTFVRASTNQNAP